MNKEEEMSKKQNRLLEKGDYVLATKYSDGSPNDHWVVGFYNGEIEGYDPPRYDVVDYYGNPFRGNGFRRVKKITPEVGAWMIKHGDDFVRSVWGMLRIAQREVKRL